MSVSQHQEFMKKEKLSCESEGDVYFYCFNAFKIPLAATFAPITMLAAPLLNVSVTKCCFGLTTNMLIAHSNYGSLLYSCNAATLTLYLI